MFHTTAPDYLIDEVRLSSIEKYLDDNPDWLIHACAQNGSRIYRHTKSYQILRLPYDDQGFNLSDKILAINIISRSENISGLEIILLLSDRTICAK
jgi:hypothetical protein